ncbi:hypothetical protein AAG720_003392 [Escherichia coli]|uniref:hypothetical protein n=1 Tax=Escherichia coli TaxID=562 RepID=UPI0005A9D0A6|nr:hypothetical protein [Escherichia coli]EFA4517977.1 hypothetical protein [Escherichia coli]EFI9106943.1 hypothetical protein [Escherichia coli]EFJ3310219.1 hypothetical protein [Escherichia coli]EFN9474894.1 hypothetical protein [Escherichia coli]EFN9649377.1 hypothetical protein [Escherichia coli]
MVKQTMQQNHQYYRILSGESRPFPGIYEAVSEQLLLLIFKARQLYHDPKYRPWFEEQHRVLKALRDNTELRRIFTEQSNTQEPTLALGASTSSQPTALTNALNVMCHLYNGFDEGNISLKSWGAMQEVQTTPDFFSPGPRTWKTPELAKFVGDDLFNILTECKAWSSPIPAEARQGYYHQDLSVAHSCTSELLERLQQYHEIDEATILARTIGRVINGFYLYKKDTDLPAWLSPFKEEHRRLLDCSGQNTNDVSKLKEQLMKTGRTKFVGNMFQVASWYEIQAMYDDYVNLYADEIIGWFNKTMKYFRPTDFIRYTWKFATVTPNKDEKIENTTAWKKDYCQITIQRDELLRLIRTNTLQDAAINLAGCLQYAYRKLINHDAPRTTKEEQEIKDTNSVEFLGIRNRTINTVKRLESFEKWYENNKVLLVSNKKIRTEKIDVVVRVAGLKAYDLQEGVPDGPKQKVKDGINERIKTDTSLCLPQDISDTSLNRYRHAVQRIINDEIDTLLMEQKKKNKRFPYSEERGAIRPLWEKCLTRQ